MPDIHLAQLIRSVANDHAAEEILGTLQIDRTFLIESAGTVSRGAFTMALHAVLFHDLLNRVPTGAAYVGDRRRQRERIVIDHGAMRTVRFGSRPTGSLPAGVASFSRILEPLGYHMTGAYPFEAAKMTGRAFTHREFPESLPQFFISELHAERFSKEFQAAAERVFGNSRDPLTIAAHAALAEFADQGRCEMKLAAPALKEIVGAFGRWHATPALADYRILQSESMQGAWIATEGGTLAHASERVSDVAMTACAQRSLGRPVVGAIETSPSGSVRRAAFKADPVKRSFRGERGSEEMTVPGSFYEFISRDIIQGADGRKRLDLRFDHNGAQAIFKRSAAG